MSPKNAKNCSFCWIFFITMILRRGYALICDDGSCDQFGTFTCSSTSTCQLDCYDSTGCNGKTIIVTDDNPHGAFTLNCYGASSCADTSMNINGRDTYINCNGTDSCDSLKISFTANNASDPVEAIISAKGEYSDDLTLTCTGDGVGLCKIDCVDVGGYYTCIDFDLDCFTTGQCIYHCDNSSACCGCTLPCSGNGCTPILYENNLRCYEGRDNCFQVKYLFFPCDIANIPISLHFVFISPLCNMQRSRVSQNLYIIFITGRPRRL